MNFEAIQIRRVSKIDRVARNTLTLDLILVTEPIRNVWEGRVKASLEGVRFLWF
jgi:hypothetical protein